MSRFLSLVPTILYLRRGMLKIGGSSGEGSAVVGVRLCSWVAPFHTWRGRARQVGKAVLPDIREEGPAAHPHPFLCSQQTLLIIHTTLPGVLLAA